MSRSRRGHKHGKQRGLDGPHWRTDL